MKWEKRKRQRGMSELAAPMSNRGSSVPWGLLKNLMGRTSDFSAQGMKWVSLYPQVSLFHWSRVALALTPLHFQPVPGGSPVDSVGICTTGSGQPWADTATLLLSRAVLKPVQLWPLQQTESKE